MKSEKTVVTLADSNLADLDVGECPHAAYFRAHSEESEFRVEIVAETHGDYVTFVPHVK